jgi:hypothetical protein
LVFGEKSLPFTAVVADDAVLEGKGQERRSDSNATDSNSTSRQWATDLSWVYRAGDGTDSIWLYFPRNGLLTENQSVPSYDEWLTGGQEIPAGLVFTGGTPWSDESTALRRQPREVYEIIFGKEGGWKWKKKALIRTFTIHMRTAGNTFFAQGIQKYFSIIPRMLGNLFEPYSRSFSYNKVVTGKENFPRVLGLLFYYAQISTTSTRRKPVEP